ncbi:hypothetical protein MATL_G00249550 [Megalops atlanticus]|uniref:Coiled-coil domain-containing protein 87 n=1 Tax=Megalops atlanticus TaxID=7932 RepID=A0A9D3T0R6_MEGAT|nr:hypothetical protein MATL_G00249550 [Megalops atlanticus]
MTTEGGLWRREAGRPEGSVCSTQMGVSAQSIHQRYHSVLGPLSLFPQCREKEGRDEEQCPAAPGSEGLRTRPSSLQEFCHLAQCRMQARSVRHPASQQDQQTLTEVLMSKLGLIWQDLTSLTGDPTLTQDENKQLHCETFREVIRICEELYLHYLSLLHALRKRAIFSDQANLSRVRAHIALDCTNLLSVHSIKDYLTARIKALRTERLGTAKGSGVQGHKGAPDTRSTTRKLNFSLQPPSGRGKSRASRQHKDFIERDLQEINEAIGDLDLELVYDLTPSHVEQTTNRGDAQCTEVSVPSTTGQKEDQHSASPCLSRLKGSNSVPELQQQMLLEETEKGAWPVRPQTPLVLQATSSHSSLDKSISPAEDLKRLLQDSVPQERLRQVDPEADLPPLIKPLTQSSTTKLELLQQSLQRLNEEEDKEVVTKRAPVEELEHPQADVDSITLSPKHIARTAASRVSDRVFTETIKIQAQPPVYNDLTGEIEQSSVQWMDRNLFVGAEVTELYRELSKSLSTQYLNFDEDPIFEPAPTDISFQNSLSSKAKSPCFINPELKRPNISNAAQRRRAEIPKERERPQDVTSREHAAWLQWWKSHLSLGDYLKFLSTKDLDYLSVVFHLYDSDEEGNEKSGDHTRQQEEERQRRQKIDALRHKKQEFAAGVWNVNSVLLGGLGKDPAPEDVSSDEDMPLSSKQEQHGGAAGGSEGVQLQTRLENIWNALRFPDGLRQDMALKYSSDTHRDRLEEAIVAWECAAQLIQQRETLLHQLEVFEKDASDPNRFFQHGYRGTSMARMDESRHREKINSRISVLEKELQKIIKEIKHRFHDTVTYRGRPYAEKMRRDRIEMLYWLQQERRVEALERVLGSSGTVPARLPPLEPNQQTRALTPHPPRNPHPPGSAVELLQ